MSALLAVTLVALSACGSSQPSGTSPPSSTSGSATTTATTTVPPSSTSAPPTTTRTASLGRYMPLYPFSDAAAVAAWQDSYRAGGHQPWHLDAGQSALAFAAYLGYSGVNKVLAVSNDASGAHVSVGFSVGGSSSQTVTSAVVHLVRWGTGSDIPWEVVGTDDTTFSLTSPAYGATVRSPFSAGGSISGVDESIKVQAFMLGSASPVGGYCCVPAGGSSSPWRATVAAPAAPGTLLTVAASTGGHVAAVERFAVTGVVLAH